MDIERDRPRLADHVRARRHVVGGEAFVVLADDTRTRTLRIGEREWRLLSCMDGTRDLEGVRRAAGSVVPLEELARFVEELGSLELLGPASDAEPESAFARDLPIEVLPGARFRCDGRGACCDSFDSVVFTPLEQARARAAAPDVLDGGQHPTRVFLPAHGLEPTLGAAASVEGRCAFRDPASGRCCIYEVRPHGCQAFPMASLDVGDAIRVSLRTDCACALAFEGPPLEVPARGSALPRALFVPRLPQTVRTPNGDGSRQSYLRWLDALATGSTAPLLDAVAALGNPLAIADRLAAAVPEVEALRARHGFRSVEDPTRRGLEALARALPGNELHVDAATEARFLTAALFVLEPEPSLAEALSRLVLCVEVARRFTDADRALVIEPLATVAALMRGHGLTLGAD